MYLELIKNQGREIGTQLLEIIVLMARIGNGHDLLFNIYKYSGITINVFG